MGMSTESISIENPHIPIQDPVSASYALADIVNIALVFHEIAQSEEDKKHAEKIVWSMVNKWLEEVGPLKYLPGLVEELASMIKKKLWESNISEDHLTHLLVDTIVFKEKALMGDKPEVLNALAESLAARAEALIEALGGEIVPGTLVYNVIYRVEEPEEKITSIITLIGLALVLSTNL